MPLACRPSGGLLKVQRRWGPLVLQSSSSARRAQQTAAAMATTTVEAPPQAPNAAPETSRLFMDGKEDAGRPAVPHQQPISPARLDAEKFVLDASVARWLVFGSNRPETLRDIMALIAKEAAADTYAAQYWAPHLARLLFFASQSASALVAHALSELVLSAGIAATTTAAAVGGGKGATSAPLSDVPAARVARNLVPEISMRLWESCGVFKQDLAWIHEGTYKFPWDIEELRASQYRADNVVLRSVRFLAEAAATLQRTQRQSPDPNWLRSPIFPQYYQSFHNQTDGWLSSWSADIYEHSTEVLFWGRQDAMQRTALVPISQYVRTCGRPEAELMLLEVAAGTGRFHTFIRDNWPGTRTICSDLSPFYLARARENMREWKRLRQPSRSLGRTDDTGVEFLQAAAEDLRGVPDASVDVVVCVYLFHELPEAVRRKVLAEWFRVLKPGGLAVLTDSYQLGDRPELDMAIHRFGKFNEPYYVSYVKSDLGGMGQQVGFQPGGKWMSSFTKTLSFVKPLVDSRSGDGDASSAGA